MTIKLLISRAWPALLLATVAFAEKQIKLEDIEKDNLKSAEQAKLDKQYQKFGAFQNVQFRYDYQPQSEQYQQPQPDYSRHASSPQYTQEAALSFQQPSVTYQAQDHPQASGHSHYSPYVLPFNPAQLLNMIQGGNYASLPSNSVESSQNQQPAQNPFIQYYSQQLHPVSSGQAMSSSQQQPVVMSFNSPSLAAFQQQATAYYQGLSSQVPQLLRHASQQSSQQYPQFFYQPQLEAVLGGSSQSSPAHHAGPAAYSQQQLVPQFQMLKYPAGLSAVTHQDVSHSPYRSFAFPGQYTGPQTYSSSSSPQSSFKSPATVSHHQFLQALSTPVGTTPTPAQKYNSPQYLAQNYNTISSSGFPKTSFSGVKPTASPIVKISTQGGFLPSNPSAINYQNYRSVSG